MWRERFGKVFEVYNFLASVNPSIISKYEIIFSHTVHLHARRQRSLKSGRDAQNLGVQLKSGIKEDVAAQKCLFGMNLGNFRFYILLLYALNHLHTSLCGGVLVILALNSLLVVVCSSAFISCRIL